MKNEKAKSISEDKKLDEMELQRMLEVYGNDVLRLCTLYLKDRHLAEDALQETFIKVWQKYHTYLGQANEKTWIMRIAINVCKNYLRTAWIKRNSVLHHFVYIFSKTHICHPPYNVSAAFVLLSGIYCKGNCRDFG